MLCIMGAAHSGVAASNASKAVMAMGIMPTEVAPASGLSMTAQRCLAEMDIGWAPLPE
jgi:hypothetical protein